MIGPLRVTLTGNGRRGTVTVDGVDLSAAVFGYRLVARAKHFTELELDLAYIEPVFEGEALVRVCMSDEVRAALIHLGWTPPVGGAA